MLYFKLYLKISTRFKLQVAKTSSPVEGKLLQLHRLRPSQQWPWAHAPSKHRSAHTYLCAQPGNNTSKADRNTQTEHEWPNPVPFSILFYAVPQRFAPVDSWSWVFPSPQGWCSPGTALEELGQGFMSLTEAPLVSLCSPVWVWAFHHRTEQVISGNRNGTETLEITQDLGMFRNVWVT